MIQNQAPLVAIEPSLERATALMTEALALLDSNGLQYAAVLLDHAINVAIDAQMSARLKVIFDVGRVMTSIH